jgi:hypothetical protein
VRVIWRIFELEKEIGWLDPDNFHRGFTGIAEKQLWVASRFVREEQISQECSRILADHGAPHSRLAWLGRVRDPAQQAFDSYRPAIAGS